jgi:hypothetical protein
MSGIKLTLTHEGAEALREFARSLPNAIENIESSTEKLSAEYKSMAESLGIHKQDFESLLACIKKAQSDATDAIAMLVPKMNSTADKIDDYIAYKASSEVTLAETPGTGEASYGARQVSHPSPFKMSIASLKATANLYGTVQADKAGFQTLQGYKASMTGHTGNAVLSKLSHATPGQKIAEPSLIDSIARAYDMKYAIEHPNEKIKLRMPSANESEQIKEHTLVVPLNEPKVEVDESVFEESKNIEAILPNLTAEEYKALIDITPIHHGHWVNEDGGEGMRGESKWCPADADVQHELQQFGVDGIEYKNGYPNFTVVSYFGCTLEDSEWLDSDRSQFNDCNFTLLNEIEDDPKFSKLYHFDEEQMNDLENGKTPYGYTWHHDPNEKGLLLLVPTSIHQACRHSGGRSSWGGGAKCR